MCSQDRLVVASWLLHMSFPGDTTSLFHRIQVCVVLRVDGRTLLLSKWYKGSNSYSLRWLAGGFLGRFGRCKIGSIVVVVCGGGDDGCLRGTLTRNKVHLPPKHQIMFYNH